MNYVIKQGSHYSTCELPQFHCWDHKIFSKIVTFSEDCNHPKGDGFISKLFGISQGFPHQANYLLFGWRWREEYGGIELLPYRHVNWGKTYKADDPNPFILLPNTPCQIEIDTTHKDVYIFRANHRGWVIPRETENLWMKNPFGYTLKPYFGGQPVAPHDMHIEVV